MFAGPNGSGKSTLKSHLPSVLLGVYLNPDELELEIARKGFLDFSTFGINTTAAEALAFFQTSPFLISSGFGESVRKLTYTDGHLEFRTLPINSYIASVASDFIRRKLIEQKTSFTFETVMSHPGKIDLLTQAKSSGYRTYLYFVATDDPAINISRVRSRVKLGGHAVPEDRIEARYHRSLDLLMEAIQRTNRAYIFDNSGDNAAGQHTWLAEITEGRKLELKSDQIPAWFTRAVLNKIA